MDRPFLTGEKIYLRPFDLDDIESDYAQWVNDREIIRFLASNAFPKTKEDLREFVVGILNNKDYVFFAVIEKESNKFIGTTKIGPINWIDRCTRYGLMLSKENWGKGYATDVFKVLLYYVFEVLNLNRIIDIAVSNNTASIKANEKSGIEVEGTLKEMFYKEGHYYDGVVVGLTQTKYFEKKKSGLI